MKVYSRHPLTRPSPATPDDNQREVDRARACSLRYPITPPTITPTTVLTTIAPTPPPPARGWLGRLRGETEAPADSSTDDNDKPC